MKFDVEIYVFKSVEKITGTLHQTSTHF